MPDDASPHTLHPSPGEGQSQVRARQLDLSPTDLANLLETTEIGAIFLHRDLRIKSFTPAAAKYFKLTPADIGRPLSEITDRLADERLVADAQAALDESALIEREVRLPDDTWVLARLAPYRTEDDQVAGVVATSIDITPQKRAENQVRELAEELEKERRFFLAEMASLPDFVYRFDLEGRFTYINKSLLDLWQRAERDAIGKNFHELDYPPELAAKLQRQIQEVIQTRRPLKDQTPYTSAFGSRQYEYIFSPLLGESGKVEAVGGVTRDITSRLGVEEALRGSEERFRLLVEGARDYAMFLLDPANVITFWSKGAERVLGWSHEEAMGKTGDLIFVPEDRARGEVEKEINTALTEGRAPDRRFHLRKDRTRFWADGVLMRLDDDAGNVRGFAKVTRDASDQREIEDALRHARDEMEQRVVERTRDLLATNTELERAMQQRQELEKELLEISEREKRRIGEDLHDMVCQELTATALFLKSGAKKVASKNRAAAATLEEAAQIVNRNVGLTRDLARGLQPADLKGAGLKNALRSLAEQACETSEVKCHFKATRGTRVTDDTIALHLYRVAQEALKNAVKHSGARNILIHLDNSSKNVCVSVQDDGKGFSPRKRTKGLGLHIMRYRANALGGELKIEKRRSGGMDITCVIPNRR